MSSPPESRGGSAALAATEGASPPPATGALYTMAEAARLKGVSYHTVSRAVRRGKLPVTRLGRMALIDADQLRTWTPMRERAPRKYRQREPDGSAPAMLDLASRDRVDMAHRLSTLYQVLHGAAGSLPLPNFLDMLSDRLAGALDFRRVAIWSLSADSLSLIREAAFGGPLAQVQDEVTLAGTPAFARLLGATSAVVIDDVATSLPDGEAVFPGLSSLFAVPLVASDRLLGLLLGDCDGEPFTLSEEQVTLAQVLTTQAALAMDHARLRHAVSLAATRPFDASAESTGPTPAGPRRPDLVAVAARASAIADTAIAVNTGKSLTTVLDTAVARMVQALGSGNGVLFLLDDFGSLTGRSRYPATEEDVTTLSFPLDDLPTTRSVLERREPRYYTCDGASATERECLAGSGWSSAVVSPLVVRDEAIGVVFINFPESAGLPSESDLAFAGAIGGQCAAAIDKTAGLERLEAAHLRLMTVIDQLPQAAIFVEAPSLRITLANQAADRLWGMPLLESPERSPTFADRDGVPFVDGQDPLRRTIATGRSRAGEVVSIRQPDGTIVTAIVNTAPALDAAGRVTGAVAVLQDTAQLRSLDRGKDEFLSIVAHELRNPLTSLRGNMQLLLRRWRRSDDPDRQNETARFESIISQVDRMGDLVNRLLDVSRADLGRLDVSIVDGDAATLVRGAVEVHHGLSTAHHVVAEAPDSLPVRWDVVRIGQVLTNLLSNAVKYTSGGTITVTLEEVTDGIVEIAVIDRGPGISDVVKDQLFDRYYRAPHDGSKTSTGALEGMGIGLYISHNIARAHGGDLRVEDTPGGGATFTLRLPRFIADQPASDDP